MRGAFLLPVLVSVCPLAACADEGPPPKTAIDVAREREAAKAEAEEEEAGPTRPTSSASDAREGEATEPGAKADPTQPYLTKVGEAPPAAAEAPDSSKPAKASGKAAPKGASGGSGAVSKAECDRAMDRYLELEIANNPQLAGVPPEVIQQAKQMARQKHGEAPCTATRAQYTCAMSARSTAAWQSCMK